MITLGLNPFSHDSSAAIVQDGVIIAAVAEERFTRMKHTSQLPVKSIQFCLNQVELDNINQISEVSINFNFRHWTIFFKMLDLLPSKIILMPFIEIILNNASHYLNIIKLWIHLRLILNYQGQVKFYSHHLCHAASTYFSSPFQESTIITLDGRGESTTAAIFKAVNTSLTLLHHQVYPHSIGLFYTYMTEYLGFLKNCDEGKVMGLAPYGTPKLIPIISKMLYSDAQNVHFLNLDYFDFPDNHKKGVSKKLIDQLETPRASSEEITCHHRDVAFAVQAVAENAILAYAQKAKTLNQSKHLCLSGGVALNSVTNGKIIQSGLFEEINFYPASGDDGTAVGAAFIAYYRSNKNKVTHKLNMSPYLGPYITDEEIIKTAASNNLKYKISENVAQDTAHYLSQNKLIAWVQDRAEFGPRALGNRTILADPRHAENKDRLNAKVKFRESFRPFAPSVLEEKALDYFENCTFPAPYMIVTFKVKPEKIKVIPAVTHIDGTARVQTVNQEQNPSYYQLIKSFYQLTGVPVVLNTSFNRMGEPIVNSAQQAITCFLESGLDILVLNKFIFKKD